MKALFLSALIASLSITGNRRRAHAASVQELCVSGKVTSTTTPAQGPNIAITNCQWAASAIFAVDPNTTTSLVVSGGTTLGSIVIDFGTPVNPIAITFSNNFSTTNRVIFRGQLKAGSSVAITDCLFEVRSSLSFDFRNLGLTSTDFVFSRNLVRLRVDQQGLHIPPCRAACTYTVNDNVFNHTVTSSYSTIQVSQDQAVHHSITFVSRRNRFLVSGSMSTVSRGYFINLPSIISTLPPETLPSNWSLVTDEEARNVYGKSTFIITDNLFNNVSSPWLISDENGADFTIENNTMSKGSSLSPGYGYSGNYYRFVCAIRNNTLTNTGNSMANVNLNFPTLPAYSSVLIQNNTITTGGTNLRIVRLQGATLCDASALVEISGNMLFSSTGQTGLLDGTVYAMHSTFSYEPSDEPLIAASSAVMLFDNTLFGVPIDTHELTLSTVRFANNSRTLKIDSPYPKATTTSTASPTTSTASPTTSTASPTTSTASPTTSTASPTTSTASPTTTNAVLSFAEDRSLFAMTIWGAFFGFGTLIFALTW